MWGLAMDKTVRVRITKIRGTETRAEDDTVIAERETRLFLNGAEFAMTVMTPGDEDLWAVGHLAARGVIGSACDLTGVEVSEDGAVVTAEVRTSRTREAARERRGMRDLAALAEAAREGIRWLADAPLYTSTGGAHVAALVRADGTRLTRMEDVGRHNAVDKVLGWALVNGVRLSEMILATSGRLTGEMASKAGVAGVPVMASVSAATNRGVEEALRYGVTLIGFVRGDAMNVYTDA